MSSSEDYLDSLLKAAMKGDSESNLPNNSNVNKDEITEQKQQIETNIEEKRAEEAPESLKQFGMDNLSDLIDEDPNKALSPDEIAAMFARAQAVSDSVKSEPENSEPKNSEPENKESNKGKSTQPVADSELHKEEHKEEAREEYKKDNDTNDVISNLQISDDPNRALSPDEIAAMFAMAQASPSDTEENNEVKDTITETGLEAASNEEKDELADKVLDEVPDKETEEETDSVSDSNEVDEKELVQASNVEEKKPKIEEEMEIDLDDPEALDILLGIKEKPAKPKTSVKSKEGEGEKEQNTDIESTDTHVEDTNNESRDKETSESDEQDLDSLLNNLGEDDPELKEIGELLKKSDQHELVDDDILSLLDENQGKNNLKSDNEDVLEPEETEIEKQNPNEEDQNKVSTKKKKEKKKGSFFKRKKKEDSEEEQAENSNLDSLQDKLPNQETTNSTDLQNIEDTHKEDRDTTADTQIEEDQEASVDDFIQSFASGEIEDPGIPEKKSKKSGKASKEKNKLPAEGENQEKSKGFFSKIFDALTEEVEEEEEEPKPKKQKKGKKGKKSAVQDASDNEGILEELDAEEDDKKKKKKKPKKEAKPKKAKKVKEKKPKEPELEDSKKLPSKMVIRIFVLCFSIMAFVLIVVNIVPDLWDIANARNAFYKQDYATTYTEMCGKKLSKSDERLYQKSKIILQLQHKIDAYSKYKVMKLPVEALDSLLSGYAAWVKMTPEIAEYEAVSETDIIKNQILSELQNEYQLTEEDALQINALNDYDYTLKLEELTGHLSKKNSKFKEQEANNSNATAVDDQIDGETQPDGTQPNGEDDMSEETMMPLSPDTINQDTQNQQGEAEDVLSEEEIK